ncbi:MAG: BCCT family transporter [Gammaproteobacteria bacterium]|nr:BCCT family transporter [Gammaproteobacteria bacterium]
MSKKQAFHQRILQSMEPWVFLPAAVVVILFVIMSGLFTDTTRGVFRTLQQGIVENFGWFYMLVASGLLVFIIWLLFSRFGKIRLGGDDARPEFGYLTWFSMLLSAGMGIGIVFFGAAEPLLHYLDPPFGEGETEAAMREAMRYTFFHWGLHPWAIYSALALPLAYFHFRYKLPLAPRSLLYPLLGDRIYGAPGHVVDVLCTVGTLFGVATSLGLGSVQINAGFHRLFDMPQGVVAQLILIACITAVATLSVVTGLHKGMRLLSQFNIGLALLLLLFVLLTGPTLYILELFVDSLGYYLQKLPYTSLHINPGSESDWQAQWTLFYWSWWISWSPFVGVFVARISKGRTVREFVTTTMLVPSLGGYLWFSAFGGTSLHTLQTMGDGIADIVRSNEALALFAVLEQLPLHTLTWSLATVLIIIFFVTSSDSGSFVDDMVTSGGHPNPPRAQRLFWALAEGTVAAVLLYAGGLNALRTASLTMGLPMAVFIIIACVGLVRALRVDYASQGVPSAKTLQKQKVPPRKSLDVDRPQEEERKREKDD